VLYKACGMWCGVSRSVVRLVWCGVVSSVVVLGRVCGGQKM
jgi:hypothetical protein